jgi:2-oxoglutarate dehydrogenase complex dehydrogenase (E1) component-like enzyme
MIAKHCKNLLKSRILIRQSKCCYQTGQAGVFGDRPRKASEIEDKIGIEGNAMRKSFQKTQNVLAHTFISVDYKSRSENPNAYRLVSAFRSFGHKYAAVNPVPCDTSANSNRLVYLQSTI